MDAAITIVEFKNHLQALGYAPATMESYRQNLDRFRRYLEERGLVDLRQVTHPLILDYQARVMAEPIAMESKALKIRPVKRFFEYLVSSHKLLVCPTDGIVETSRKKRPIGTVLTIEEMRKLLSQPNLSLKTGIRDRAILEVLYATAIRLNELLHLEIYHVDLAGKVLTVRKGKGGKERVVPLTTEAVKYLKEYLEKVRPWHARKNLKERRLFLQQTGLPLSPASIRQAIRGYRLTAGIKKPVSPHTLRRTCATHLLQRGTDIRYIQKLLGHRHLETTQAYTKVMPVEVKRTHERTHPGKNL